MSKLNKKSHKKTNRTTRNHTKKQTGQAASIALPYDFQLFLTGVFGLFDPAEGGSIFPRNVWELSAAICG
jgi:hypothetical protein